MSCPFCDPQIKDCVFFESKNFLAVYNIAPVLPGHSLVIPRDHIVSFIDLNPQQRTEFLETTTRAVRILLKAFHTDAFDLSIQEKPEAGQTIEHLHLHILPRLKGDMPNPGDWYPVIHTSDSMIMDDRNRKRLPEDDLRRIVDKLRNVASRPDLQEHVREV
ncbi:MAG: HIT family protein [Bacteroidales bacterium]|nr:HIT family protein [Bacteroidales bacterium]